MTQPNPDLNSATASEATAAPKKPSSRWKGPAIAVLLSLIFPGLGQLKNRQPWRGFVMAWTFPALTMFAGYGRIFLSFKKMIAFFALTIFWKVLICIDAFRGARQGLESRKSFQQARVEYVILVALILASAVTPSTDYFLRKFGYFRAFRVSSASMCPTICEGERIVADMDAYLKNPPQRGDLILLDFHSEHRPFFIKRVVGIAGDIVSERAGIILVNGKPFREQSLSQVCGKPKDESSTRGEEPRFDPVTVPVSSFFVVGDNSSNSYDSRIPGFGLATSDQIKGRPLHIYWSSERSRIGCDVR